MMNVAVVGTGAMGSIHADVWSAMPGVRLAAIAGWDVERTRQAAIRCGTAAVTDLEALMKDKRVDVIDLCIPTHLHKRYTLLAAEHGKHVICEKPIALEEEDALEMIEACRSNGVQLHIAHVLRFFPEYVEARRMIKDGELGEVGLVLTSRRGSNPSGSGNWYANPACSGGVPLDLLIHDLDWIRWTFGEVRRLCAAGVDSADGYCRHVMLSLRMMDGTIARLEASWAYETFYSAYDIYGKLQSLRGSTVLDNPFKVVRRSMRDDAGAGADVPDFLLREDPYYRQLRHFQRCMTQEENPIMTPVDALEALRLAKAAVVSMETGQTIDFVEGSRSNGGL